MGYRGLWVRRSASRLRVLLGLSVPSAYGSSCGGIRSRGRWLCPWMALGTAEAVGRLPLHGVTQ